MRTRQTVYAILFLVITVGVSAQENQYSIQVKVHEDMSRAYAVQKLVYHNTNDFPLDTLRFRFHNSGKEMPCPIKKITDEEDNALSFVPFTKYSTFLAVALKHPLNAGVKTELTFEYDIPINIDPGDLFIQFPYRWYPRAIPYRNNELKQWNFELASYRVEIEYPANKTIVVSGKVLSDEKKENGYRKNTSKADRITDFNALFFDDIRKDEREVEGIDAVVYYHPEQAPWMEQIVDYPENIIRFYVKEIGFYPQEVVSIVPGSAAYGGGYGVASNIYAIHGRKHPEYTWEGITAHEIGHTYWGYDCVMTSGYDGYWLKIGMGMYTDDLYSNKEPPYFNRYLAGALLGYNMKMILNEEESDAVDYDWNGMVAHSKSFSVIKMLEYVVGKETFREIFRTLLNRYKFDYLSTKDFWEVCEEISGKDLDWFFQSWLYTNDILDYIITEVKTQRNDGRFITRVGVKRTGEIPMPVEVEIETLDGKKYIKIIPKDSTEGVVEFKTSGALKDVRLDPKQILPLFSRADDQATVWLISNSFRGGFYEKCLDFCQRALLEDPKRADALYHQGQANMKTGRYNLALKSFQKCIDLEEKDEDAAKLVPWIYIRRGYIFDLQGLRDHAVEEYKKALEFDDYRGSQEEAQKRIEKQYEEE